MGRSLKDQRRYPCRCWKSDCSHEQRPIEVFVILGYPLCTEYCSLLSEVSHLFYFLVHSKLLWFTLIFLLISLSQFQMFLKHVCVAFCSEFWTVPRDADMPDRIESFAQDSQRERSRTPRELYGFPTWARPAQPSWPQPPPPPHFPPVQPRQLFPASQQFIPQSQPYTPPSTPIHSPPPTSSPARAYDLKINNTWTQDADHYDSTKQHGLELFRTIRASQFSSQMGIEGCDPLALPLSAMLYATTDHQSLRRLSHGRELYIIPTSDIASCIFMTKLNQELKRRGVDLDRASQTYCREQLQQTLDRSTAIQKAAEAIAQTIQRWIPIGTPDPTAHARIAELTNQLAAAHAELQRHNSPQTPQSCAPTLPATTPTSTSPILRSLHGQSPTNPPPETTFEPSTLLVQQTNANVDTIFQQHPVSKLNQKNYQQWIDSLAMDPAKKATVQKHIEKSLEWWRQQPDSAYNTLGRVAVGLGIPPQIIPSTTKSQDAAWEHLVRILVTAISMANWLGPRLQRSMQHRQLMQLLTQLHSMILVLALLTPFTPSISVQLFNHFRIAQTRLMILHVLHSPKTNTKLRSILQAAALHPDLWSGHTDAHPNFAQAFSNTRTTYLRFSHHTNFLPKFYVGSTEQNVLTREYNRYRKFLQLKSDRLVLCEVALRYWETFDLTFSFGLPFPFEPTQLIFEPMKRLSFKNGNHHSTFLSLTSSTTQERPSTSSTTGTVYTVWSSSCNQNQTDSPRTHFPL